MRMTPKCTVLMVEDNLNMLNANRRILEEDGMAVLTAASLAEARGHLQAAAPDVVVLDIMLPDGDGLEFLSELRQSSSAPVLFLTAKSDRDDRLAGLRAGGNDYITKPYDIDEFRARVAAFASLAAGLRAQEHFKLGALEFDMLHQRALVQGRELPLTRLEFGVLLHLARHAQRVTSSEELYEAVWRQPLVEDSNAVRKNISGLRQKLAGSGYIISSEYGGGYRLERGGV